jgi:tetratricopeptide (TPR) repeat protein
MRFISVRNLSPVLIILAIIAGVAKAQISTIPQSASQTGFGGGLAIDGTVLGPSGRPVEIRVRVRLSSTASSDRITFTNETGNFAFIGLPEGRYVVAVDKEKDFEPVSYTVDLLRNSYRMVIRLSAKPSSELTGVINAELTAAPEAARAHFVRAGELIKERDRRGAVEALKAAIATYPEFALAYNELGIQYIILREYDNALDALAAALKIKPDYYDAQLNVGVAYLRQKKYVEAEKEIRAAGKMKETTAAYHYHLGVTLANLGRFDEAEPELRAAIKVGGDSVREAHRILSIIYSSRGDDKKCLRELEAYVKLTPNAPDIEKLKERIAQLRSRN